MISTRLTVGLRAILKPGGQKPIAGKGSLGLLLEDPELVRRAIVFVHGFTGSPLTTWNQFQMLIDHDDRFEDADAFFYGYDSTSRQLGSLAFDFKCFLDAVLTGTVTRYLADSGVKETRGRHTQYEDVIIVGHSLGGPVVRQALVYADQGKAPWLLKCSLVLFAPAHCGARLARLAIKLVDTLPCLAIPASLTQYLIPAHDDLHPKNSPYLATLRSETDRLAAVFTRPAPSPFRARCVFGEDDLVVIADHFANDIRCADLPHKGHTGVCKPNPAWRWPLEFILPEGAPCP